MADFQGLLHKLESENPSHRYEACEELRVSPAIPEEALAALRKATNDPQADVAEAAARALAVHAIPSTPPPPDQALRGLLRTESAFKSGASWFFWIAGLSLINSIVFRLGGSLTFIFGLGVSQVVDVLGKVLAEEIPEIAAPIQVASVLLGLLILAAFVLFGIFAHRRHAWAFVLGMIAYGLDALVLLAFRDFVASAFHLLALFGLYRGIRALRQLKRLELQGPPAANAPAGAP